MSSSFGNLYLVPTPLDFGCETQTPLTDVLPAATLQIATRLKYWITENAKSTRAFLKRVNQIHPLSCPIQEIDIQELPLEVHKKGDFASSYDPKILLSPVTLGHDIGLVSEAGMPAIADPGSYVVQCAHKIGITVIPLVGPSSLLLSLAASGFNGQNFSFVGYLPIQENERKASLLALEKKVKQQNQTQLFIETPWRNRALLKTMLSTLDEKTLLFSASNLTLLANTQILMGSVREWQTKKWAPPEKSPTVFAIGQSRN